MPELIEASLEEDSAREETPSVARVTIRAIAYSLAVEEDVEVEGERCFLVARREVELLKKSSSDSEASSESQRSITSSSLVDGSGFIFGLTSCPYLTCKPWQGRATEPAPPRCRTGMLTAFLQSVQQQCSFNK